MNRAPLFQGVLPRENPGQPGTCWTSKPKISVVGRKLIDISFDPWWLGFLCCNEYSVQYIWLRDCILWYIATSLGTTGEWIQTELSSTIFNSVHVAFIWWFEHACLVSIFNCVLVCGLWESRAFSFIKGKEKTWKLRTWQEDHHVVQCWAGLEQ